MGMTPDAEETYESDGKPVTAEQFAQAESVYIADDTWIKQSDEADDVLLKAPFTASGIASLQQFRLPSD